MTHRRPAIPPGPVSRSLQQSPPSAASAKTKMRRLPASPLKIPRRPSRPPIRPPTTPQAPAWLSLPRPRKPPRLRTLLRRRGPRQPWRRQPLASSLAPVFSRCLWLIDPAKAAQCQPHLALRSTVTSPMRWSGVTKTTTASGIRAKTMPLPTQTGRSAVLPAKPASFCVLHLWPMPCALRSPASRRVSLWTSPPAMNSGAFCRLLARPKSSPRSPPCWSRSITMRSRSPRSKRPSKSRRLSISPALILWPFCPSATPQLLMYRPPLQSRRRRCKSPIS